MEGKVAPAPCRSTPPAGIVRLGLPLSLLGIPCAVHPTLTPRASPSKAAITARLAEFTSDVLLRMGLLWIFEDLARGTVLDQVARACAPSGIDVKECRVVCYALGLLQIVRHEGD